jgi:hypothetical protein
MATARQIAANQANSLRSTGPRSPRGKAASRANSLKHGLSGKGIVLPQNEVEVVQERFAQWHDSFKPFRNFDVWLVERVAVESVRVDRCRLHEVDIRERDARRAEDFWDEDRRLAAAELAAGLPRRPDVVSRQLERTLQGVELLIERWEYLGKSLASSGTWDEQQRATALDLMGVPRDQRSGRTPLVPDEGDFLSEAEWFAQHVECRLRDLRALLPALEAHDASEQLAAMKGHGSPSDAELKRLRRYEKGCLRNLQWAVAQLKARKKEMMPFLSPNPTNPEARPAGPELSQWQQERREESQLATERFGGWASLAFSGVDHEFVDPDAALAEALHEEGPDDGTPEVTPEPVAEPADDRPAEEPSPPVTTVAEPPSRGLLKPVPLTSALRKTVPSNRRARRAAKSRARRS